MTKNTIRAVRVARLPKSAMYQGTWGRCDSCHESVPTGTGHVVGTYLFCEQCWNGETGQPVVTHIAQNAPVQGHRVG